ncbi:zinc-dependent peptidase [Undibacterium sp. RuRC25W]|uniref:M90 family metallopeptidase n=1 Tax=Undibacterium sp. RuRC25W TaxID=3413047 RepID=UPI003BEFD6E1
MGWLLLIVIALLFAFEVPRVRLRYILRQAFPLPYSRILRKNLPEYSRMPTDLQMQLKRRIRQFLYQKKFVGCGDLEITDEIRVTIAGKACMLLLNRPSEVYPKLTHILVYSAAFVAPRQQMLSGGIVTHTNQGLSGESWSDGRVILAWDQVLHGAHNELHGQDVVMHEFAHQLDSETGQTNGAPLLSSAAAYRAWSQVMEREYESLLHAIQHHHHHTVIDPYGATNPAEFFAVSTEAFFKKSTELAQHHPALYEQLRSFYQVEPRDWV